MNMAVPVLNLDLFRYFTAVFSFLFIFVVFYAILEKTKILGDKSNLNALFAFIVSILLIITPGVVSLITVMIAPFAVLIFFILFVVVLFMFMGISGDDVSNVFKQPAVITVLIVIGVLIFLFSFVGIFGEFVEDGVGGLGSYIVKSLFNAKVLGAVFLLLVASQAIRLLSEK